MTRAAGGPLARLVRATLTHDERVAALAIRWLSEEDVLEVRSRTVGGGLVGGKATGMLLARSILRARLPRVRVGGGPDDSWFVGSSLFRDVLAASGVWAGAREGDFGALLARGAEARARILAAPFPEAAVERLAEMLERFAGSPVVVRSSSLLEDGFGDAFTGKYDSVFCGGQGTPAERLEQLLAALRAVYASAVSEEALRYREHRGLLERDEAMAAVVQRVSGTVRGTRCFPLAAGVALSHNPWPWSPKVDPRAGVARLVLGLGTRAVERSGDDHTRLVALNAPELTPEADVDAESERTQRRVDVIDLAANRLASLPVEEVAGRTPAFPLDLVATRRRSGAPRIAFDRLLSATPFVAELREVLGALAEAYGTPVDVEFTVDVPPGGALTLDVLQCRPLRAREGGAVVAPPAGLGDADVLLESRGPVIGLPTHAPVDRVVFVDPDPYDALEVPDRNEVGAIVGRITRLEPRGARRILLLGPGRWGTSTVALGVPVSFAQIQRASAIAEVVTGRMARVPDPSLGSHFFSDLVEADLLYLALYPDRPGYRLAEDALRAWPNRLPELLPEDARLAAVVRVVDFPRPGDPRPLWLNASCVDQRVVCFLAPAPGAAAGTTG